MRSVFERLAEFETKEHLEHLEGCTECVFESSDSYGGDMVLVRPCKVLKELLSKWDTVFALLNDREEVCVDLAAQDALFYYKNEVPKDKTLIERFR